MVRMVGGAMRVVRMRKYTSGRWSLAQSAVLAAPRTDPAFSSTWSLRVHVYESMQSRAVWIIQFLDFGAVPLGFGTVVSIQHRLPC